MPEDSLTDAAGPHGETTTSGRYSSSVPRIGSYATLQVPMGGHRLPGLAFLHSFAVTGYRSVSEPT